MLYFIDLLIHFTLDFTAITSLEVLGTFIYMFVLSFFVGATIGNLNIN